MRRHELEERLGCPVKDHDWPAIEFVYTWSPEIENVGGKDQIADLIRQPVANCAGYSTYPLHRLLPAAIKAAKDVGVPIETHYGLQQNHDVFNGYCYNFENRKARDVFKDVEQALRERGLYPDEYFSCELKNDALWPEYRWLACYAVRGGSEGYYVHVDAIDSKTGSRQLILLGKTLQWGATGRQYINSIANALTEILEA